MIHALVSLRGGLKCLASVGTTSRDARIMRKLLRLAAWLELVTPFTSHIAEMPSIPVEGERLADLEADDSDSDDDRQDTIENMFGTSKELLRFAAPVMDVVRKHKALAGESQPCKRL